MNCLFATPPFLILRRFKWQYQTVPVASKPFWALRELMIAQLSQKSRVGHYTHLCNSNCEINVSQKSHEDQKSLIQNSRVPFSTYSAVIIVKKLLLVMSYSIPSTEYSGSPTNSSTAQWCTRIAPMQQSFPKLFCSTYIPMVCIDFHDE